MALVMWLEAIIFILLLFLVNAIIILVFWFCQTITSSGKSKNKDPLAKFMELSEKYSAQGVGVGYSMVAEALGSGRHKRPHNPPNYSKRWSSRRVSDLEDSSSDAEAHMTTALRAHCPNRNDDVRCVLAMQRNRKTMEAQRINEEARLYKQEEKRLSKQVEDSQVILRQTRSSRLSVLSEGFNDVNICLASELQKSVEQETEEFNQELHAINWNPGGNRATGFSLLDTEEVVAASPTESLELESGVEEYRRYNALVPVRRFDADYTTLGQPAEHASNPKE